MEATLKTKLVLNMRSDTRADVSAFEGLLCLDEDGSVVTSVYPTRPLRQTRRL
jgi:hypothetical protein